MTKVAWTVVENHPDTPIVTDAMMLARRLNERIANAFAVKDLDTVKWLHKQLVSVERRAQEREVAR